MLGFKISIILLIWYHSETGGFNPKQTPAVITLILPLFVTYSSTMFKYIVGSAEEVRDTKPHIIIKKANTRIYLLLSILYGFAIMAVILGKVRGNFDFESMQTYLASVETGFGIYIGAIISSLLKKGESDKEAAAN